MAYGDYKGVPRKERPHAVIKIIDPTGQTIEKGHRYSVKQIGEDGDIRVQLKGKEYYEVIATYDSYAPAHCQRVTLSNREFLYDASSKDTKAFSVANAWKLPAFFPELPESVLERREYFLTLEVEEQETMLETLVLLSARPKAKILTWLGITEDEIDVDDRVFTAAAAELDLRVARKVLGMALSEENTPATERAAIYLTKVLCGWSDNGVADDTASTFDKELAKSLFDGLTVVETHRDENGVTISPPTELRLVKSA